jgi:phenylalanyl-tRNA synthetase beta chain
MKVSLDWLAEFVTPDCGPRELGDRLTMAGFELESLTPAAPAFSGVVVAEILEAVPHPQADRLRVCRVSTGAGDPLQIVCGAPNARAGLRSALATVGAALPGGLAIKAAKLRGVESAGMLCSARELGLAEGHEGILELPPDAPVGASLRDYLRLDDTVLELAITPNRGDAMSVLGIAREVAALAGQALPAPVVPAVSAGSAATLGVRVEDASACPRFLGRVIEGIDNARPSPHWVQERLRRAGVRSISPVVDVTNYVLLELGQPMHAYDLERLSGGIVVRKALAGERCTLLEGSDVELTPDVLVIADAEGPVAMAGVMGGARTAVSATTSRVFLEVAWFHPDAIAGRGRRYGLTTDASQRFERGVDPEGARRAIERATALILGFAGGTAGPVTETVDPARLPQRATVPLRRRQVERLLGVTVADDEAARALQALGMQVTPNPEGFDVRPPSHRFDIAIERDLIEEVARLVGYSQIPAHDARFPQAVAARPVAELEEIRALDVLAARGYHEGVHFSFVDPALQETLFPGVEARRVANPISSDLAAMRVSLWPGLIRALQENLRRQQDRVRLVEHGVVFLPDGREVDRLAAVASGSRWPEQWAGAAATVDFHDLRADLEALLSLTGPASAFVFEPAALDCLHPGRSARILRGRAAVGWIGELHPATVRALGLPSAPVLFELDYATALGVNYPPVAEVSRFPQVRRDLAVVVDEDVPFSAIRERVTLVASGLMRELRLFDVYRGPGVEKGRKSVALGLIFQEKDRTLTDQEIEASMAAVRQELAAGLKAGFRE